MKTIFLLILTLLTVTVYGQDTIKNLDSEMTGLNTETVLIANSQAIDYYPLWSLNSDFIACNIQKKWYKFRLTNIALAPARWRGQTIGVLITPDAYSPLGDTEQEEFNKVSKFSPRKVTTKDETEIELRMKGMSVSLIVTKKGKKPKTLWTSELENCHSLVLSPNEKYVAYLCEMNGLFIMKLK